MQVMSEPPEDMSVGELRVRLADVINDAAVRSRTTYITNRGRRVAAIVPVPIAEAAEKLRDPTEC